MTDARAGRVASKTLIASSDPAARVGRVASKTLIASSDPQARVGRVAVKVLASLYVPVMSTGVYGPGFGLGYRHFIGFPISHKVLH